MFAALLSGLEFSFTAHAKDIYTSDPHQLREKLGRARFVVTCTEYNRRHLKALAGADKVPIYRVYHGIDIRLFQGKKDRHPSDPLRLLTVARMTPKKGLPTVFRAVRHLRDRGVAVEHVLIGDGEARQEVLDALHRFGLEGVVRWLGTQPHHVVVEHYRRADVFVLGCEIAATGDRDGIPNVLLESMAMATPVVATTVSAIPELIRDGVTGLLVPPGNPEAMARAITRLTRDDSLRQKIVHQAKETVSREFDNRELIKELAGIYRREIPGLQ
jgi:glycosyltransferase involved in cell wall biosynthesis